MQCTKWSKPFSSNEFRSACTAAAAAAILSCDFKTETATHNQHNNKCIDESN